MEKCNREKSITGRLDMQKNTDLCRELKSYFSVYACTLCIFYTSFFPQKDTLTEKKSILIYSSARFHVFTYQACECQFQRSNRKAPLELKEFETSH